MDLMNGLSILYVIFLVIKTATKRKSLATLAVLGDEYPENAALHQQ
jgi:hypothetical protein